MQSHTVSASGGTEAVRYFVAGSYMDQDGTVIGTTFNRSSFRANLDAQMKKWLKLGMNFSYSKTHERLGLADSDEGIINTALLSTPDVPIYDLEGHYTSVSREGVASRINPIAKALDEDNLLDRNNLLGNIYLDINLMQDLVLHSEYATSLGGSKAERFRPTATYGTWKRTINSDAWQTNSDNYWQLKNYLTYNKEFGLHKATLMQGQKQEMVLSLKNTVRKNTKFNVVLVLKTDMYAPVDSIVRSFMLKPGASLSANVPFYLPAPGFYRCTLFVEKEGIIGKVEKFNIGYEPEKIVSPVDAKPDFEAFWKQSLVELKKVNPEYRMELIPERSTGARNVYHVWMKSFGELTIEGFYAVPKTPGKYPAIIYYMGYGSEPWYPHTDGEPGFASFVLSVRGQGIQKAIQKDFWGDWLIWGLDSKGNYYYRGAFMDLVRGVDFLVSRPEVDADRIVAEGGSQGGAFTLAACALDHRIKAAAPAVPFLSDYRDYFRIVSWPRSAFETYLALHPEKTWEQVYDILTYFDIKNLAGWIQCPIFMAAGLQDEVCPNRTNFASYNLIRSEKQYRIYREQGHGTPVEWNDLHMDFFKKKLGM